METSTKPNTSEEDLQIITAVLKEAIPDYDELLEVLENNNGWLPLKSESISLLSDMNTPWRTLYEDKNQLERLSACVNFEEKVNASNNTQQDTHIILASFFNCLALMIHGRSMCQLITDAKSGDDAAFCLAVQIDRTVLQLPYFQKRLLKSQFSDDEEFLKKLASRIQTPILQSKIRYRTLMFTFAVLDIANFLDKLSHEKLLNICVEIKVTGGDSGIDDVDKLGKRLQEYKKITRM